MADKSNPEKEIFERALDIASAEERLGYLKSACGEDVALLLRVQALLKADQAGESFLPEQPEAVATLVLVTEKPGDRIGRYKLLQQIGEGGCGVVHMAEQQEPVRRQVALKVIKLGMDTRSVIARFEAERQALAMMDHPNIAKVFDAGATETGRPYFVMELVRGIRITEFCDQNNLPTRERLDLFTQVCHAIQHAHQKGIIHRDIKPSNILVTLRDGVAVPKVIDFGIAKATQQRLTDKTLFTAFQQFIGTPAYMSPEQAEMSELGIDTRSDIYSLGVLLYELLTGKTPFDANELLKAGLDEIRRTIREQEPPRPSTRLSTLAADALTATAKHRHTDAPKLIHLLRGDLDWIVMKCLEKDRARRYETANGLAMDVERHLKNETVVACPPSRFYRFQKLVRRNKLAFGAAAAIAVSLVIGLATSIWQAARAKRAEHSTAATLNELRATAPAFFTEARALVAQSRFDDAISKLAYAAKLRPDVPDYPVAIGNLLECRLKFPEAAELYRAALKIQPAHAVAAANLKLCEELLAAPPDEKGRSSRESLAKLYSAMQAEQRSAAELLPVAQLIGEDGRPLLAYWLERLKHLAVSGDRPLKDRLSLADTGRLKFDLSGTAVADLSVLKGMPLGWLNLFGCSRVSDLSPLRGLPLRTLDLGVTGASDLSPLREVPKLVYLDLTATKVVDLTPVQGLQLKHLNLTGCGVTDLRPLRGMPLEWLYLRDTHVSSLEPLRGMPLAFLDITGIPALDFDVLRGMPLETLFLQTTRAPDLGVLKGMPLKQLSIWQSREARNYAALAELNALETLLLRDDYLELPEEELAAIESLQQHPRLRQIGVNVTGFALITPKEEFWRQWNNERAVAEPLRRAGIKLRLLKFRGENTLELRILSPEFSDLRLVNGTNLGLLNITDTRVSDLTPLAGLPLKILSLQRTPVADIAPLRGMPLEELWLGGTKVSDLAALRGLPLHTLDIGDTAVRDLAALERMALEGLFMQGSKVTDLSPLRGMPLRILRLDGTSITDLTWLGSLKWLEMAVLPMAATDLEPLRALPHLQRISFSWAPDESVPSMTPAKFWRNWDRVKGYLDPRNGPPLAIVLGRTNLEDGLHLRDNRDGVTEPAVAGGQECRRAIAQPDEGSYVYFAIDPAHKTAPPMNVMVEVEYFDDGDGGFSIEYDAGGEKRTEGSAAYTRCREWQRLTGSQRWQSARFLLEAARFDNGQNADADFRLAVPEPQFHVRRVTLRGLSPNLAAEEAQAGSKRK
jgi:Leucine-rich repeat (LRR) protein